MSKNLFIILFLGILVFACSDIFEKDIEDDIVVLLAPADQLETKILSHTFWWEKLDDALKYNLQIVKLYLGQAFKLELDTNLTVNMFEYQLNPGTYQWKVKAYNGSSETEYSVFSLQIDSTTNLAGQSVSKQYPTVDEAINSTDLQFKWRRIDVADEYELTVKRGTWESEDVAIIKKLMALIFDTTLVEGLYSWDVIAYNDESNSDSNPRAFEIDTTSPGVPSLTAPANNIESTTGVITFTWTRSDGGSEITDRILIATDTTFASDKIVVNEVRSEKEFPSNFTISGTKVYYWKVIATDKAGNQSAYSERRKFTLKNAK